MKSVILGTDYIKDADGSFKVLETNTSIGFTWNRSDTYFSTSSLDSLIADNSFTEAHLIFTNGGNLKVNDLSSSFSHDDFNLFNVRKQLTHYLSGSGITVETHYGSGGIIPEVEDGDNKLIIRQAYDQTAIFDETYAKDNFKFLKVVHDQDSEAIPNTFIPNTGSAAGFTIDTIGSTFRNNGNYPNYIIKKRYPTFDYGEYPKIFKLEDQAGVQALKDNLLQDEFLQEYIINTSNIVDGKLPTYRTIDLIYGSSLDRINMADGFMLTTLSPLGTDIDYDDNNQVQAWDRAKLVHKISDSTTPAPIAFNNNLLLSGSGVNISGSEVEVNDVIKTLNIEGLLDSSGSGDTPAFDMNSWTGSMAEASGSTIMDTTVADLVASPGIYAALNFNTEGGRTVTVPLNATPYFRSGSSDKTFFQHVLQDRFNDGYDGYSLVLYDNNTNSVISDPISSVSYKWETNGGYDIDVEEVDTYFVEDGNNSNVFITLHNNCSGYINYDGQNAYCSACGPSNDYSLSYNEASCCTYSFANSFFLPSCAHGK